MSIPAAMKMDTAHLRAIEPIEERVRICARSLLFSTATLDQIIQDASAAELNYLDRMFLLEHQIREDGKIRRLTKRAKFPVVKSFEGYDFSNITFPAELTNTDLLDLSFMDRQENIVCLGPVGTGKTHLMIALGMLACSKTREVRYFSATGLIAALSDAKSRGTLTSFMNGLSKADAIMIDEFGYVPVDRDGARLLFQVISEAYERQSLIITTNIDFSRWGAMLADDQMASAIIDRVAHHGHLLLFEGESFRLRHALMRSK